MSRKSKKPAGSSVYLEQRSDSPNWYIVEYDADSGRCSRFSTRTADHGEAETRLAQHILTRDKRVVISDATVTQVIVRYWSCVGRKLYSGPTVKCMMRAIADHEPLTRIYDWPSEAQRAFIAKISDNKGTQRRYWGILRTACAWMCSDEVKELPSMPALVKLKDKEANSRGKGVRPFSVDEMKRLFEVSRLEHEQRLLLLCVVTNARPGAVLDLTWDRIDLEHGFADLNVPGRQITNKRRSIVPLSPTVVAYLKDRRSIGPVVQWKGRRLKTFKMTFQRLTKEAGITGTAYRIRKGVATYLRSQKISVADMKAMLSHSLGGVTDEYAHYDPDFMTEVKAAMERLLGQISAPFLASYSPVPVSDSAQVADLVGGRDRDRTCDHHHVKVELLKGIQQHDAANDDDVQIDKTST